MATEAEIIPEHIAVVKTEEEIKHLTLEPCDKGVEFLPTDVKFQGELSQPAETIECLTKAENMQVASNNGVKTMNNVSEGNPEISKGESFLVSPEISKVANETCVTSEHAEVDDTPFKAEKILDNEEKMVNEKKSQLEEDAATGENEAEEATEDRMEKVDTDHSTEELSLNTDIEKRVEVEVIAEQDSSLEKKPGSIEEETSWSQKSENEGAKTEENADNIDSDKQVLGIQEADLEHKKQALIDTPDPTTDTLKEANETVTKASNSNLVQEELEEKSFKEVEDTEPEKLPALVRKQDSTEATEQIEISGSEEDQIISDSIGDILTSTLAESSEIKDHETTSEISEAAKKELYNSYEEVACVQEPTPEVHEKLEEVPSITAKSQATIASCGEIKDVTGENDGIQDKNVLDDSPFMKTEEPCLQKVDNRDMCNIASDIRTENSFEESPAEESRQSEINEKAEQDLGTSSETCKDNANSESEKVGVEQKVAQDTDKELVLAEASDEMKRDEEPNVPTPEGDISEVENIVVVKLSQRGKQDNEEILKESFQQQNEPEKEMPACPVNAVYEDANTAIYSENAETSTSIGEVACVKDHDERFEGEGMEDTLTNTDGASEHAESKEKDVQIEVNENNETVEVETSNKNVDDLHVADSLIGQSVEKEKEKQYEFSDFQPEEKVHEANGASKEKEENGEDVSDALQSRNSTNAEHIFTEAAATSDLKSETSEMDKEIVKEVYLLHSEKCSENNEALENKQKGIKMELEDSTAEKPELEEAMQNILEETKEVCKGPNSTIKEECAIMDESIKSSEKEMHDSCQEDEKEETPEVQVCEKLEINTVEDAEKQIIEEKDASKDQTVILTKIVDEKSKEENTGAIMSIIEVCEESETEALATARENPESGEHPIADISNSSITDETVKGSIKEDESCPKILIEEASNSNIEETDSSEATTVHNLEETAEPNKDPSLLKIGKESKKEITAIESKEDLAHSSSLELEESKEDTEKETSVKESITTADSDSASPAAEMEEANIKEAEAEEDEEEINNVLAVEEKGLATTEHEGIDVKSAEIDVKPVDSPRSCERMKEIPQEGDRMHDEVPNAGGEDQMEMTTREVPIKEILGDEVKEYSTMPSEEYDPTPIEETKISDETLEKDQAPDEHSESPGSPATDNISMQKEDNPTLDVPKAEPAPEDIGKETGHEVKEHLAKEPYVHKEQESGKCSSVSEVTNVSNGEESSELDNESDACEAKIQQDEQSSDIRLEKEKVEDGKPLDEAADVEETLGTSKDTEKTIQEQDNLAKNLEKPDSLKEDTEVGKEQTELPRGAHDQITEVINVNDNAKLALADFEGKAKPDSEPVVDQSKETFPVPSKSQDDETSTDVQNQETEKQITQELEDKLDNEDHVNRDQNANEVTKAVIRSEEVDKEFEKSGDSEDIKEHVIEEESSTELRPESKVDETTNKVDDYTSVSTECLEEADSNKQIEARKSKVEEHSTKDREASLIVKESEERRRDEESAHPVSVQGEDEESEEKIEDFVYGSKLCQDKTDIEAVTKVREETSLNNTGVDEELDNTSNMDQRANDDHELVETKSDVSKTSNADELGKMELASGGDLVSEGNGIEQEAQTKKSPTAEEQEANEDEEAKGVPKTSSDLLSQRVETIVEDDISSHKTLPEEKTEEELQTSVTTLPSENEGIRTTNSVEEIEEEILEDAGIVKQGSLEDSFDTETNEEVRLQQEGQRQPKVVSEEATIVDHGLQTEEQEKQIQTVCSTFPSEERKDAAEATSEEIHVVTGAGMTGEQPLSSNKPDEATASFALLSKEEEKRKISAVEKIDEEKIHEAEIPEDKISEDFSEARKTTDICLEKIESEKIEEAEFLQDDNREDVSLQKERLQKDEALVKENASSQAIPVEKSEEQISNPGYTLSSEEHKHETLNEVGKIEEEKVKEEEMQNEDSDGANRVVEISSEKDETRGAQAILEGETIASQVTAQESEEKKIEEEETLEDDKSLQSECIRELQGVLEDAAAAAQTLSEENQPDPLQNKVSTMHSEEQKEEMTETEVQEDESPEMISEQTREIDEASNVKKETHEKAFNNELVTESEDAAIEEKLVKERDQTVGEENECEKTNEENEILRTEVSEEEVIEAKEVTKTSYSTSHSEEQTKDGSGEEELQYKLIEDKTSEALEMTCQNEEGVQKEEPGEQIQTASSIFPSEEKEEAAGAIREEIDGVTGDGTTGEQTFSENKPEEGTTSFALLSKEHDRETISSVEKIDDEKINEADIPEDKISEDSPDAKKTAETCLEKEEFQEPEDAEKDETAATQAIRVEEPKEQSLTSALPSEKIEHGTTANEEEEKKLKEAEMLEKEICLEKERPQEPEAVVDQEATVSQASITEESVDGETTDTIEKLDEEKKKETENLEGEICEDSSAKETEDICLQKEEQNHVPEEGITSGPIFSEEHSEEQLHISTSTTTSREMEHETKKMEDEETKKEETIKHEISEDASDARTKEEICSQKERSIDLEAVVEDEMEKKSEEHVQNETSALSSKEEEGGNANETEKIESKKTEEEEFLQDEDRENVSLQEERLREDEALVKDENASSQTLPTKKREEQISNADATLPSEEHKHETVNKVDKTEEEKVKDEKVQNEDSDVAKTEAEICSEKDETKGPQAVLEGETIASQVIEEDEERETEEKKIEEGETIDHKKSPQSECVRELQCALEDGATATQTLSEENQLHITASTLPSEEKKEEMKGTELQEDESPEKSSDQTREIEAASNTKMETHERNLDNELLTESEDAANEEKLVKERDDPAGEENDCEKTKEGSEIILDEVSKDEVITNGEVTETYYLTSHSEEVTKDGSREDEPKYKLIEDKTSEASETTCQNEEGLQKEEPEKQIQTTPVFPYKEREDAAGAKREEADVVTGDGITGEQILSANRPEEGATSFALLSKQQEEEIISIVEKIHGEKINEAEILEDKIQEDSSDEKKAADMRPEKEEFQEREDDKKDETAAAQAIQVEELNEQSLTLALPSENIEHGTTANEEEEKVQDVETLEKEICLEKERPQEPEAVVDQETTIVNASTEGSEEIKTTETAEKLDEEKIKEAENLEDVICEDSSATETEDICLQKEEPNALTAVPEEVNSSGQTISEKQSDEQLHISTSATSQEREHETKRTEDEQTDKEEIVNDEIQEDDSDARTMEEICSEKDELEKKSEEVQNQTSALFSKEEEGGNTRTTETIESEKIEAAESLQDDNREDVRLQKERIQEDEALVKDENASSCTLPMEKSEEQISNPDAALEEHEHETVNEVDKTEEEKVKEGEMRNEDTDRAKTAIETCSEKDEASGPQAALEGETIASQVIEGDEDQETEEKKTEEGETIDYKKSQQSEFLRELQGALEDGATAAQTLSGENQPDQLQIATFTLPSKEQKDEMKETGLQEDASQEKIPEPTREIEDASNAKMKTQEKAFDNELLTKSEDAANEEKLVKERDEPAGKENECEKTTKEGSETILNEVSKDEVIMDEEVNETYYSTSHSEELTKDGSREDEPKYKLIEDKINEASETTCQNEEGLQKEEPEKQIQTTPAFPYKEREDAAGAISEEVDVVSGDGIAGEQTISANEPEEGTPNFTLLSTEQEEETISMVEKIDEEKINEAEILEDKIQEDSSDEKKTTDMCSEKEEFQEREDAKKDETAATQAIQVEELNQQSLTLALPSENIGHETTANEEEEKVQDVKTLEKEICLEKEGPQEPEAAVDQKTTIAQASTEESVEIKTKETAEKLDEEKIKEAENPEDVICEDSSATETEDICFQKEEPNELPAVPKEANTSGQTFSGEQSDEQLHISTSAIISRELEHETKRTEDEQTNKEKTVNDEIQEDASDARTIKEICSQRDGLEAVIEDGMEKKSEEQVQNQTSALSLKEEEGGNSSTIETTYGEQIEEAEFLQDNREDVTSQKERVQEDEALVKDENASSQALPMEKSGEQISDPDATLSSEGHKHETVNKVDKTEEEKVKGEMQNEDTDRANTVVETCSEKEEARGPQAVWEAETIANQVIEEDKERETEENKIEEGETIDNKKSPQSECLRELQGAVEDGTTAAQTLSGENQPDQLHITTSKLPSEEQKDETKETEVQEDKSQEKIPEQTREIEDASNVKMDTRKKAFDNDILTELGDAAIEEKLVKERDEPAGEENECEKTNEGSEIILNEASKEEVIEDEEVTETSYSTSHSEELTKDGTREDELNYKLIEDKTNEALETCQNEELLVDQDLQKEEPERQIQTTPSTFPYEEKQNAAGAISEEIDVVTEDGITDEQTLSANKPEEGTPSFAVLSTEQEEETISKVEKINEEKINEAEIPEAKISEDSSDAKKTADTCLEKEFQEQIQTTSSTFPCDEREDTTADKSEEIAVVPGDGITGEQNPSANKPEGTTSFTLLSMEQEEETISTVEKEDKEKISEAEIPEDKISDDSSDAKKTAGICLEKKEFQEAEDAMKNETANAQAIKEEEPKGQSLTSAMPPENIEHGTTANEEEEEKVKEVEMQEKEICLEKERPQESEAFVDQDATFAQASMTDKSVEIETIDTDEKLDEEKTKEAENLEDEICEGSSVRESEDICFQKEEPNDLHAVPEGVTLGQSFSEKHSDEQLHISTSSTTSPELEHETKKTKDEKTNKDETIKDEISEEASDARTKEEICSRKERSIELEVVVEDEMEKKSEEQVQIPTSPLSSKEEEGGNTNITEKIESEKIEEAECLQDDNSEDGSLQRERHQEDEALVKDENASSQTFPTEKSEEQISNPDATLPPEEDKHQTVNKVDKTEEDKLKEEEMRHENSDEAKTAVETSSEDQTRGPQAVLEGETIASQVISQESEEKKIEEEETLEDDKSPQSECGRELQDDLEDGATVAQTLPGENQPDQLHITTSTLPSAEQKDETEETELQEDKSQKKIPEQTSEIEEASNVKMEMCEKAFDNKLLIESEDAAIEEKFVKERDETAGEENECEKTNEEKQIIMNEVSKEEVIENEEVTETSYSTFHSEKLRQDDFKEDELNYKLMENKINKALETTCQNEEGLQKEEPEKQIQTTPSAFAFEEREDAAGAISEEIDIVTGDGIAGDQTLSAKKPEEGSPSFALLSKEQEEETICAVEKIEKEKINEAEIPEDKISEDSSDAKKTTDICLEQEEFHELEDAMKDETAAAQSLTEEEPKVQSLTSALPPENIKHRPTANKEEEAEEEEKVKEVVMLQKEICLEKERHQEPEVVVDQETNVAKASITEESVEIETVDKVDKLEEKPKAAENLADEICEDSSARETKDICLQKEEPNELPAVPEEEITSGQTSSEEQSEQLHISTCAVTSAKSGHETKKTEEETIKEEISEDASDARTTEEICSQKERSIQLEAFGEDGLEKKSEVENPTRMLSSKEEEEEEEEEEGGSTSTTDKIEGVKIEEAEFLHDDNGEDVSLQKEQVQEDEALVKDESASSSQTPATQKKEEQISNPDATLLSEEHKHEAVSKFDKTEEEKVKEEEMRNEDSDGAKTVKETCSEKDETMEPQAVLEGESISSQVVAQESEEKKIEEEETPEDDKSQQSELQEDESPVKIPEQRREIDEASNVKMQTHEKAFENELVTESEDAAIEKKLVKEREETADKENQCDKTNDQIILNEVSKEQVIEEKEVTETSYSTSPSEKQPKDCSGEDELKYKLIEDKTNETSETTCQNEELLVEAQQSPENDIIDKQIVAEDKIVDDPGQASVARIETATVTQEESEIELSSAEGTKELAEGNQIIEDIQQPKARTNIASDEQIPRELDPIEITEIKSSISKEHALIVLQYRVTELSQETADEDVKEIYPKEADVDHSGEKIADNSGEDITKQSTSVEDSTEVSSPEHVKSSAKETWQVTQDMIEEREAKGQPGAAQVLLLEKSEEQFPTPSKMPYEEGEHGVSTQVNAVEEKELKEVEFLDKDFSDMKTGEEIYLEKEENEIKAVVEQETIAVQAPTIEIKEGPVSHFEDDRKEEELKDEHTGDKTNETLKVPTSEIQNVELSVELKEEHTGDKTNETLKVPTSEIQNFELSMETSKDSEKEIFAEDEAVKDPEQAPLGMKEATIVREEIPGEADPTESKRATSTVGKENFPTELQDGASEISVKAEAGDLEPGNAQEICSQAELRHGDKHKTDNLSAEITQESASADSAKLSLSALLQRSTREKMQVSQHVIEERELTVCKEESYAEGSENKDKGEEGDDNNKTDSGSDAPVMVEAPRDTHNKAHKKSHNILSGVGSKVKHSISKVKKAITGKSSHSKESKPISPKGSKR